MKSYRSKRLRRNLPTARVNRKIIEDLLGRKISSEEFADLVFNFKGEIISEKDGICELELNTDRPDIMSSAGLAAAFRRYLGVEKGFTVPDISRKFSLVIEHEKVAKVRPYISIYYISGVRLNRERLEDLIEYQEQLHRSLSRGRKKFAIGIHDAGALKDRDLVYTAESPEKIAFRPLNCVAVMTSDAILKETPQGRSYGHLLEKLNAYPVLRTLGGEILSLPPIVNSALTEVKETTREILIDVTGENPDTTKAVAQMLCHALVQYGERAEAVPIKGTRGRARQEWREVKLDTSYVRGLLGVNVSDEDMRQYLERAGFNFVKYDAGFLVSVPLSRVDVLHPVDIVEDIAIMHGYDRIDPMLPNASVVHGGLNALTLVSRSARDSLSSLGFIEVNNLMLSSGFEMADFSSASAAPLEIANPWSADLKFVRTLLTPKLLSVLVKNQTKPKPIRLFEVGPVCSARGELYKQGVNAAALISDNSAPADVILEVFEQFGLDLGITPEFRRTELNFLVKGRAAEIVQGGKNIGFIGEVSPDVLRRRKIDYPASVFEMTIFEPDLRQIVF